MRIASLALLVATFFTHALIAAEPLQVGVAVRDITPPIGYRMSGYFYERLSTGTHDPLHAKALFLQQGDQSAALVFCDLIGISRQITDEARKLASEKTKIPAENILIAATHSHTGPLYGGVLRDYFHEQAVAKHGHDPAEKIVDYPALLVNRLVDAIASAQAARQEATVDFLSLTQQSISFNRRFHMKDGSVRFNPGRKNPDIVRVAGPIDPELCSLRFASDKQPLAMLNVFALHLDTIGGTEHSGDFPHYLQQHLGSAHGVCLFGAGTCGDINHIDVTADDQPKGQAMAQHIAAELTKTLQNKDGTSKRHSPVLAVKSTTVDCPLQKYSDDEIGKAKANFPKIGGRELSFLEQVEACKIVALAKRSKDKLPLEVQVFQISQSVAIVGLPGEVFVELGLAIKERSPFEHTIVIELCNDSPAYIPTKKAFAEGSYETVNSIIAPGGGELLVEAAVKLLNEIK